MRTIEFGRLGLIEGNRVLDLGCGEGRHVLSLCTSEKVISVGVDLQLRDLLAAREKFHQHHFSQKIAGHFGLAAADALHLPFADHTFDTIICSEVLEHIPDYESALREIHRVLKPGGVLSVSVPRFVPEWVCWKLSDEYHSAEGGHVHIFRAGTLRRNIEKLGMSRYATHFAHALHVPFWWMKCLFWKKREESRLIRLYHEFLVWDLMKKPRVTRFLEKMLNPLMGKSVVIYFRKGSEY